MLYWIHLSSVKCNIIYGHRLIAEDGENEELQASIHGVWYFDIFDVRMCRNDHVSCEWCSKAKEVLESIKADPEKAAEIAAAKEAAAKAEEENKGEL